MFGFSLSIVTWSNYSDTERRFFISGLKFLVALALFEMLFFREGNAFFVR